VASLSAELDQRIAHRLARYHEDAAEWRVQSKITKITEAIDSAANRIVMYESTLRGALNPKLANTITSQKARTM
jgi:hypothetical protein